MVFGYVLVGVDVEPLPSGWCGVEAGEAHSAGVSGCISGVSD